MTRHYNPAPARLANPDPPLEAETTGLGLGQTFQALRRRWWVLLLCGGGALAAAWFLVPENQVVYRGSAVLRFQDTPTAIPTGFPGGMMESVRSAEYMTSQMHVLRSRAVVGDVVDREGLRVTVSEGLPWSVIAGVHVEGENTAMSLALQFAADGFTVESEGGRARAAYGDLVRVGGLQFTITQEPPVSEAVLYVMPREAAINMALLSLTAAPRDGAAIVDVTYRHPDPTRAVSVVNAVAGAFQLHNARGVQASARRRREFIEEQSLQAEVELARAQQSLDGYRNQTLSPIDLERMRLEQAEVVALDSRRNDLQTEYRLYSDFLNRVERAEGVEIDEELRTLVASAGSSSSPLLSQLHTQFMQYQSERNQLLAAGRAQTHPEVQRLTTLLNATRDEVVATARTQLASVARNISALESQRARGAGAADMLPNTDTEEARLLHEVEVARTTMQGLRAEHQRAQMAETVEMGQVEILDLAYAATPQMQGSRTQKLVIALVFGLLLGGAGTLVAETTNSKIRSRGDADGLSAGPELAVIPPVGSYAVEPTAGGILARVSRNGTVKGIGNGNGNGNGNHGRALKPGSGQDFGTMSAEAYRRLRANLIFMDTGQELKTFVVTSSLPGEGKTTTAANLAIAFAREGRHVLLIDCDLRRPRLHKIFEGGAGPGFIDVLLNRVDGSAQAPHSPQEGLHFLPRGEFDERAAEILTGPRMKHMMDGFRETYDVVIFDTPPVLVAAEAAVLSALTDGVVLVIRAGVSRQKPIRDALSQLHAVGANVLGFVLNDPDGVAAREPDYGYYGEYYAVEA